jgi:hypothetical protein
MEADREFEQFSKAIDTVLTEIGAMLKEKNRKYGNSIIKPVRIFSHASRGEQIKVRIDDKISRLVQGQANDMEDVRKDLIGYLVIDEANEQGLFDKEV